MAETTGHFPGAPFNAGPVTTMATASSQPLTSPSTASQVPPPAVLPIERAPSLEIIAEKLAISEPTEKEPAPPVPSSDEAKTAEDSAAPATSEAPTTAVSGAVDSTTTVTTDASTSAGTSAVKTDNTTTTNSTTTVATGKISPPAPTPEQIFQDTIKRCNNCLFMIRKLRNKQRQMNDMLFGKEVGTDNLREAVRSYKDFGNVINEIMVLYERLAAYSSRLPKALPPTDGVNTMELLYSKESTMNHIDINPLIEKMIDCGNWNEGNFQSFHYLSELLRCPVNRRPTKFPKREPPLPRPIFHSQATTMHMTFENAYNAMKEEIIKKSLGIYPKILQRSATSMVVEFLFGCGNTKVVHESDIVYTIKFVIVERDGHVSNINMMAPNETWTTVNNYGETTVDPFALSSYEVYRRLTKQANIHLLACFGTHASRWSATTLLQFVSLFGKFREVFTTKCRVCHMHVRNGLPPTVFDLRTPTIAAHEACR